MPISLTRSSPLSPTAAMPCAHGAPLLAALAFLANFLYAATSFGNGIIFHLGLHILQLCGLVPAGRPVKLATADLTILMTPTRVWQAVWLRHGIDRRLATVLAISMAALVIPGTALVTALPTAPLKRAMGAIFLLAVLARGGAMLQAAEAEPTTPLDLASARHICILAATGASAGLLSGLFNAAGPPLMLFLLFFGVDSLAWRSSYALSQVLLTLLQCGAFFVRGGLWQPERTVEYGAMVVGALAGLAAGNFAIGRLLRKSQQQVLQGSAFVLLAVASVMLVADGTAADAAFPYPDSFAGCIGWQLTLNSSFTPSQAWRRGPEGGRQRRQQRRWPAADERRLSPAMMCVPLDIRTHPAFARVRPTYFRGGFGRGYTNNGTPCRRVPTFQYPGFRCIRNLTRSIRNWPDAFARPLALRDYGWMELGESEDASPETLQNLCKEAFLKIVHVGAQNIGPRCLSDRWTLTTGLEGLSLAADKSALHWMLMAANKTSASVVLPRTYNMGDPLSCRAFWAARPRDSAWMAKMSTGFGGQGVSQISSMSLFHSKYGRCQRSTVAGAMNAQEIVKMRLLDGKAWNWRTYLLIANLNPLRAFHRLVNVKVCTEPYASRFNQSRAVRERATKCNLHVGQSHPRWGDVGLRESDVIWPFESLESSFGTPSYESLLQQIDEAVAVLVRGIAPHLRVLGGARTHGVALLAVDGLWDEGGAVKLLEANTMPGASKSTSFTDIASDLTRTSLTAFCQYAKRDARCSVDACRRRLMRPVV